MSAFRLLLGSLVLAAVAAAGLGLPGSVRAAASPVIAMHGGSATNGGTLDITDPVTPTSTLTGTVPITVPSTITSTLLITSPSKIANAITSYFSGTAVVGNVVAMHASGMGFGEIFRLYQLALLAGKTPQEITAMRQSGMGWGEIAHELSVPPGNKGINLGAAVSGHKASDSVTTPSKEPKGKEKEQVETESNKTGKPESPPPNGNGKENGNGGGSNGPNNSPGKGKGK